MTIITPTGITGITSITSTGNTLQFQNPSGADVSVSGLNVTSGTNINVTGIVTASGFVGNVTGNINSTGVSTFTSLSVTGQSTLTNVNVSGVSTSSRLNVGTGGTVITTTNNGLVGIGTNIYPNGEKLVVDSVNGNSAYNTKFIFSGTTNTAYCAATWSHGQSGTAIGYAGVGGSNVGNSSFRNTFVIGTQNANDLVLNTSDAERLRVSSSGNITTNYNIGIGIATPTTELQIVKTVAGGNGALLSIQNRSSTSGTKCGIMFGVDTSDASWSDVGNGQIIMENTSGASTGQLKFRVYDGADSEAMKICGDGTGNFRNGVAFARAGIAFDNSWDGHPGIVVFNADGYGNTANRTEFRIHGFAQSYSSYPGTTGADFGTNLRIDGTNYFSSDSRHKTNIVDNPYGLNEILQLQPRKFNRINSQGTIEEDKGDILGFIAQEVKEVIPEAVNYYPDEDTPNEIGWCRAYALSDGYILSTLVNAVKEQNEIIETLKSKIEVLESQINT